MFGGWTDSTSDGFARARLISGHLLSAKQYGSGGVGGLTTEVDYQYDALGRQVSRGQTAGGTTAVTRYALDKSGTVFADLDGGNTVQVRYLTGAGANQPLARIVELAWVTSGPFATGVAPRLAPPAR